MRRSFALLAGLLACASVCRAQAKEPPRPSLLAGADTNDAGNYYDLGIDLLAPHAEKAAGAFHWARRLNPGSADAFYAERIALLMAEPQMLEGYWSGDRRVLRDKRVLHADSLYLRALTINPFVYRKLDAPFFTAIIRAFAADAAGASNNASEVEADIESYLMRAPPSLKAWRMYSEGRFDEALKLYAQAIKQAGKKASLRVDRANLFFQLDQPDSALAELNLAAEELRKADKKDLVFVYQSKAVVEHSIGAVQLRLGKSDAARESFARALQEDLTYGPAHLQLGFIALQAKDTAAAVSEFELATQASSDDPVLRYHYGYTLVEFGKGPEAETQLRKAIALDPYYAAPHLRLGKALDLQGKKTEAVAEVKNFLALTARNDPLRGDATKLLAALGGA